MDHVLLTLVVVLLVVLIILMGSIVFLGFKLLKEHSAVKVNTPPSSETDKFHPEIQKRMNEAKKLKEQLMIEATCHLHPKEPSEGACAICDKHYCKSCLKAHENLLFCREHVNIYLNFKWSDVFTLKSTPDDPEAGVRVVEWKKKTWEELSIPLFIQTHYKINIDGDQIESWVVLFSRETDKDEVSRRLKEEIS